MIELRAGKLGIRQICKALGINTQTAYDHRVRHEALSKEWDRIMEVRQQAYVAHLGQTMQQRAITGTLKPIYHMGKVVGHERVHDNRLGMWMLERLDPDKYAEKVTVENQGTVTVHHDVTISKEQVEEHAKRAFPGMFASVLPPQLADRSGVTEVEAEDILSAGDEQTSENATD